MGFPAASAGREPRNRTHNPWYRPVIPANRYPPVRRTDSWTMGTGLRRDDGW